jgi:tRNA(fMet)-specific endonuclease VapC
VRYLLDTNILIAAIKKRPAVLARMESIPLSDLILSPVVLGELELGVAKSRLRKANAARLAQIKEGLPLIPLNGETSRRYGEIRAQLEIQGTPIGGNDYWIAAQAIALDSVLVTDNVREFDRVEGLRVENWLV